MSCIPEIQGAVVVVIIWWCDLQLHMSCITEIQGAIVVVIIQIQGAVVVVIIWWCDLQLHMSYITEIQGAVVVGFVVVIHMWWSYVIYNYICHVLLKYKGPSWS